MDQCYVGFIIFVSPLGAPMKSIFTLSKFSQAF